MKTIYIKNWFIFLMAVALVLLLIFLNSVGMLGWIKGVFLNVSSWFLHLFDNIADGIYDFWQSFLKAKNLKKENEKLKEETFGFLSQESKIKELEKENKFLKEKLSLFDSQNQIFAQVRGIVDNGTSILINQGQDQNAVLNSPVVSKENIILGKISESYQKISKVILLTNSQSQIAVMTQESLARGILYGDGEKKQPILKMVSREEEIKVGDKIVTSGFDNIFPKGFLIGEISELKKDDLGIFQEAKVKPYIDFGNLEEVFVVIPEK